jgi:hypothetical protein
MSAESRKILEMLAEGKITAEDADKLLEKLSGSSTETNPDGSSSPSSSTPTSSTSPKPRHLRIVVDKPGQEQVNVRVPLNFARKGSRLLAVLPDRVREKLAEQGINLVGLDDKAWAETIENMNIDIEQGNGKKVKIFCE